ncbi:MAG: hypothetical protein IT183_03955 [Acidobacteria bacterium]|nr:hypothetical protein [Acidobacteriota bacterium]
MNEHDLERFVDRGLKALPPRRAPGTLLPAVMAAVRAAAARPWYARPWMAWPAGWRVASAAALLALLAGTAAVMPAVQPYGAPALAWVEELLAPAAGVVTAVETFAVAVEIVSRVIGQSIIGLLLALFVVMLTTSVVIGAAIGRLALGGAYQS